MIVAVDVAVAEFLDRSPEPELAPLLLSALETKIELNFEAFAVSLMLIESLRPLLANLRTGDAQ